MSILQIGKELLGSGNPLRALLDNVGKASMGYKQYVGATSKADPCREHPCREHPAGPAGPSGLSDPVDPRVTEAVIAAVRVMNTLDKSPTGIMGDGVAESEISAVDRLVHATNRDFLLVHDRLDRPRLVRFGLFADEWLNFKDEMAIREKLARLTALRFSGYKERAINWANEASALARPGVNREDGLNKFTWRKLFIIMGIIGAIAIGLKIYTRPKEKEYNPRYLEPEDEIDPRYLEMEQ
jgi:hypothetical protein